MNQHNPSPWHQGERSIHQRMGTQEQMESIGSRVIRDHMPLQHQQFYQQLPFMVIGAVDGDGRPWASMVEGEVGFMQPTTAQILHVQALPSAGDPLQAVLAKHATKQAIGMLGIELHTRRRNRLNGQVEANDGHGFTVQVGQTFGNCPQYIQQRRFHFIRPPNTPFVGAVEHSQSLDEAARASIAQADTFFVASHFLGDAEHPEASVDVSHRGGKPGFVLVEGNQLTIPDFAGNMHFNTFGNLLLNPRAGLLFVDFASGDMLQLSGSTQLHFDAPQIAAFQGAERYWTFQVEQVVRRKNVLALRWDFEEFSANSLMTGSWPAAQAKLQAAALGNTWRPLRVSRIEQESSTVRSFYLTANDGLALADFAAGQHLPIRLQLPGDTQPSLRHYTLSCAPSDGFYRLSIQRAGRFSEYMHNHIQVGDIIEARAPQGQFVIDALQRRPAVLLAGGIGVTPMLAMLRHIVFEGVRKRRVRPTYFIYAVRHQAERGFMQELAELVKRAEGALRIILVNSSTEQDALPGRDFDLRGRIDMALLKAKLPFDDYDFYMCGPALFMQNLYDGLRNLRIADDRIHAEAFGPAALQRKIDTPDTQAITPLAAVASQSVPVFFSESGKEARWQPGSSLLELAEQRGVEAPFGCRGGSCGSCRTSLLAGSVSYLKQPSFSCAPNEALLCCAMPAANSEGTRLVLKL